MKVFISHSSADKQFVRTLKECLHLNHIETWFDEDELDLGDSLIPKLESALDTSSHIVIVLSPASIKSDWVNFELQRALKNNRTGLNNKIIPIKYRECKVPDTLTDLIYADLSMEIVLPDGPDKLKFISDGFEKFFLKLTRAIMNSDKIINQREKKEIIQSIKSSQSEINEHAKTIHRGIFRLIGFSTKEARDKYQKVVAEKIKDNSSFNNFKPCLLPSSLKHLLKLKIGDELEFEDELFLSIKGHFAGYRKDDLEIVLDRRIRDKIQVTANDYYQVEVDSEKNLVKFVNKIKNSTDNLLGIAG